MSNPTFISVLTRPVSDGAIIFNLESFDAETNVNLTLIVTGVCSTDSEEQVAIKIEEQFNNLLASYEYSGTPKLTGDTLEATFRVHRSNHVVCLWSECQYTLDLISDSSSTLIKVGDNPLFTTISRAKLWAEANSYSFTNADDDPLTDYQIMLLLSQFSAEIVNLLGSYLVLCTYKNSLVGRNTDSVMLSPLLGVSIDFPFATRRKNFGFVQNYSSNFFAWKKKTGKLTYLPFSNLAESSNPFALNNEIGITLIAGLKHIPDEVMNAVASLSFLANSGSLEGIESLSGGSFTVKLSSKQSQIILNRVLFSIKTYKS